MVILGSNVEMMVVATVFVFVFVDAFVFVVGIVFVVAVEVIVVVVFVCWGFSGVVSTGFVCFGDGETDLGGGTVSDAEVGVDGVGLFRVSILFCGEGDFAADSMSSLRFKEWWWW